MTQHARVTPRSALDPAAHLVQLSALPDLPLAERRAALDAWIAWVNAHQEQVGEELSGRLLAALDQLATEEFPNIDGPGLQTQFDRWLRKEGWGDEGSSAPWGP